MAVTCISKKSSPFVIHGFVHSMHGLIKAARLSNRMQKTCPTTPFF